MAEKRMFSKKITESDTFIEMPDSTQNLYFHLSMNADDDGFVDKPKAIIRMTGKKEDDLKLLVFKSFIIPFESGVVVIKDWRLNNTLRSDRYNPTTYTDEKKLLTINENGSYSIGIPLVDQNLDKPLQKQCVDKHILTTYSEEKSEQNVVKNGWYTTGIPDVHQVSQSPQNPCQDKLILTTCSDEKNEQNVDKNGWYTTGIPDVHQVVDQLAPQYRLGKSSIDKVSKDKEKDKRPMASFQSANQDNNTNNKYSEEFIFYKEVMTDWLTGYIQKSDLFGYSELASLENVLSSLFEQMPKSMTINDIEYSREKIAKKIVDNMSIGINAFLAHWQEIKNNENIKNKLLYYTKVLFNMVA